MGFFVCVAVPCRSKEAGLRNSAGKASLATPALIASGLQGLSVMHNLQLCCSDSKSLLALKVGFETLI